MLFFKEGKNMGRYSEKEMRKFLKLMKSANAELKFFSLILLSEALSFAYEDERYVEHFSELFYFLLNGGKERRKVALEWLKGQISCSNEAIMSGEVIYALMLTEGLKPLAYELAQGKNSIAAEKIDALIYNEFQSKK